MSTGFAFKQSLHLCSVSDLRLVLVFRLRTFKVGVSGPKTDFPGLSRNGPLIGEIVPRQYGSVSVFSYDPAL